MKKNVFLALALLSATSMNVFARGGAFSENSVGLLVGGLNGISYKGVNNNFAFQADLAFGLEATTMKSQTIMNGNSTSFSMEGTYSLWDFTFNPNLMYQGELSRGLSLFAGGGVSLGMAKCFAVRMNGFNLSFKDADLYGKFGINAIAGMEYQFNSAPVAISLDFRPGYGLGFRQDDIEKYDYSGFLDDFLNFSLSDNALQGVSSKNSKSNTKQTSLYHMFDWKLALCIRYCF